MPDMHDDDLLAAEWALRLLEADEAQAAEARERTDPVFAERVAWWDARLGPLLHAVPPVEPSPAMWQRIAARIGTPPVAANDAEPVAMDARNVPVRQLRRWQGATGVLAALLVPMTMLALRPPQPAPAPAPQVQPQPEPERQPSLLAVSQLNAPDGTPRLAAGFDKRTNRFRLRAFAPPAGRGVPTLWVIPEGGTPTAIGTLTADVYDRVLSDAESSIMLEGSTLAVSLEPAREHGGGGPQGPIVATGRVSGL